MKCWPLQQHGSLPFRRERVQLPGVWRRRDYGGLSEVFERRRVPLMGPECGY